MKKIMYSMLAFMMAAFTFTSCEDVPAPYGLPTGGTEGGGTTLPEGTYLDADFTSSLGKFKSMSAEGDGSIQWKIDYKSACITGFADWDGTGTKTNKAGVTYLVSPEVDLTQAKEAYVEMNHALNYENGDINTNNALLITDNYTGDVKTTTWTAIPYATTGLGNSFTFVTSQANLPAEFMGKKVVMALRHTCGEKSSTWEVKTLKVLAGKANVTVPDTPVTPDTPSANPQGKGTADDPFNVDAALKYITDGGNADTEVYIKGKKMNIKRPQDAIRGGIGMITEDRRGTGILGCLSIADNVSISSLDQYLHYGIKLNKKKIEQLVKDNVAKLSIKTPSSKTLIQSLSGGNQQKVLISRWLANNPDILIMDEPTRGIDVGAKYEIYQIMIDLAKQGKGIIMISSEMPELIGMSNRILVMCNGHITGEVEGEEATQERIMSYATKF